MTGLDTAPSRTSDDLELADLRNSRTRPCTSVIGGVDGLPLLVSDHVGRLCAELPGTAVVSSEAVFFV